MPDEVTPAEDDRVRRLLRGLPEVSPPDGFFDDLIRSRHRRARVVAGVGLAAALVAGAVVVGHATGITGHDGAPELAQMADRHRTVLTVDIRSIGGRMPADEVPAPFQAPEELGVLERDMAVRHPDDVVQVVYAGAGGYVSLFEQVGDVADDAMPEGLVPIGVEGIEAWRSADGAIVVRRAHMVYVLVGAMDPDEVDAVVADLPDARPMGLARRIGEAMDDLVNTFGLG